MESLIDWGQGNNTKQYSGIDTDKEDWTREIWEPGLLAIDTDLDTNSKI
jgi:hypothetical protein